MLHRVRAGSSGAEPLLELARFLEQRGLLTDGGVLNLRGGLYGRGGALSLTTQDVRAFAHGLTLELLAEPDPDGWPGLVERYYLRYDRGKPRRPSRLQRLYLQWSSDLGPIGLLEACSGHPHLREEIAAALVFQQTDDADRRLLELALSDAASGCWSRWRDAFEQASLPRNALLACLPLLPQPTPGERLAWLSGRAIPPLTPWSEGLLLASRLPPAHPALGMPEPLIALTLALVDSAPGEVDPRWLAALRGYRWPHERVDELRSALRPQDSIHRIVYGPRPGRRWLLQLLESLTKSSDVSAALRWEWSSR